MSSGYFYITNGDIYVSKQVDISTDHVDILSENKSSVSWHKQSNWSLKTLYCVESKRQFLVDFLWILSLFSGIVTFAIYDIVMLSSSKHIQSIL